MEEGDKSLAEVFAGSLINGSGDRKAMAVESALKGDLLFFMTGPKSGYFFRDFSVMIINNTQIEVLSQDSIGMLVMELHPFDDFDPNMRRVHSKSRRLELN